MKTVKKADLGGDDILELRRQKGQLELLVATLRDELAAQSKQHTAELKAVNEVIRQNIEFIESMRGLVDANTRRLEEIAKPHPREPLPALEVKFDDNGDAVVYPKAAH